MNVSLLLGDCIVRMSEMDAGTIEAVVCDPPYGINFMGEAWDGKFHVEIPAGIAVSGTGIDFKAGKTGKAHSHGLANHDGRKFQQWSAAWLTEVYRVLQPGGTLLSFGGTRTFHRLGAAMEQAGFSDIRLEAWNYANGFPKSLNVGKALDKAVGAERERLLAFVAMQMARRDTTHAATRWHRTRGRKRSRKGRQQSWTRPPPLQMPFCGTAGVQL